MLRMALKFGNHNVRMAELTVVLAVALLHSLALAETVNLPPNPTPPSTDGIIGLAGRFDGITRHIAISNSPTLDFGKEGFTYEAWIRPTAFPDDCIGFMGRSAPWFGTWKQRLRMLVYAKGQADEYPAVYGNRLAAADTWSYVVATYDEEGILRVYLNGSPDGVSTARIRNVVNLPGDFYIGKAHPSAPAFTGMMDEVRVSKIARSPEWLATCYKNQGLPDKFIAVGNEESSGGNWYPGEWKNRKKAKIVKDNIAGALADFPILVHLAEDADLQRKAKSDGTDILFTAGDGKTPLAHEIESYSNGWLWAWVKIPSLSPQADTNIYMYYNNPNAPPPDPKNSPKVWDNSFILVHHLNKKSGRYYDSTSNGNHEKSE